MKFTDSTSVADIHELRSDEFDELAVLMELAFKNSIEDDRIDTNEFRRLMKKLQTPIYKVLQRIIGIRTEFYVAEVENAIASGIQLDIQKDAIYIGNIMTHPKYQRQGLARKLLHLSFKRACELSKKKVRLDARTDNIKAVSLYSSEGFEITYRTGRFELDSVTENTQSISNDVIIREINKINIEDIDAMLDDCYPASHLATIGREQFLKKYIPSRILRFFGRKLAGQLIHTYAFYQEGDKIFRGIIQASQSRIEPRIQLSPPILFEKDNDLLSEVIPRIIEIETGYQGETTACIKCSMHRADAISKIESLGFKKVREGISMTKSL